MGVNSLPLSLCAVLAAPAAVLAAGEMPQPLTAPPALVQDPLVVAALAPEDAWAPDAVVVRLTHDAAKVVEAAGLADMGVTGIADLDDLAVDLGVRLLRPLFPGADPVDAAQRGLPDVSGWYTVEFDPSRASPEQALAAYMAHPLVRDAQLVGVHPVHAVPNDGSYASQWHLNQANDADIDAPAGWDTWTGSSATIVAVLDSGVRYYHKDLGGGAASSSNPLATDGNVWINTAEKNGTAGVDDDGNGYVDDWVGWDFVTGITSGCWSGEDCQGADNDPRDFNGHGTHCAGNVAAINNNGYATASAAGGWGNGSLQATANGVKVMCLRMGYSGSYLGQEVGYVRMDFAASAFYYAANKGARIASCSWGSSNSGGIAAAVDYFLAAGGLVFVAAGNANNQTAGYLNSRSDCYSVAATDQSDKKASFSTYGTWVDISAPGVAILSSYHVHSNPAADYVAALDGTSMATPIVASVAASVWSLNPAWTASQVWTQVRDTSDPIDALNSAYAGKLGAGRVNLASALGAAPPPPPPPPPPPTTWGPGTLLMSLSSNTSVPGVGTVADEDIVAYDPSTGTWSLYFDGSDVGLAANGINAMAVLSDGSIVMSLVSDGSIAGLAGGPSGTTVDNSDLVRFTPASLGATTAGSWEFHFDGSDVGLTTSAENIDAMAILSDGSILVSTSGNPSVPGLSSLADEDVIRFAPGALGAVTSGTWSYWIDGSDIGLSSSSEDTNAINVLSSGLVTLSTTGNFSVPGASGANEDLVDFAPSSLGSATSGSFAMFFDGTAAGLPSGTKICGYHELE